MVTGISLACRSWTHCYRFSRNPSIGVGFGETLDTYQDVASWGGIAPQPYLLLNDRSRYNLDYSERFVGCF